MTGRAGGRDDDGAASVLLLIAMVAVICLGLALGHVGGLFVGHRRAAAAADLAALAGATAHQRDQDACSAAARVADRNGSRLTRCRVQGDDVVVTCSSPVPRGVLGGLLPEEMVGRARAGPG